MNVCFLLHFYQPSNQFGDVVKKVAFESYVPLIKSIKNNKKLKITANFSLSLLEQLDCYGFDWLIRDIKDLVESGRIELVGSAAYHPLLTKIPVEFISKQVILNEMGLGFYFGVNKDFEGEDCLIVKNLKGFFPPEMAISQELLEELYQLGYEWVVADEFCLPKDERERQRGGVYCQPSHEVPRVIVRDHTLSNMISFKRDPDRTPIVDAIMSHGSDVLIALDAETFGHHNKDGIYLFESIVGDIISKGCCLTSVSEAFGDADCVKLEKVNESTWSSSQDNIYPLWINACDQLNCALWDLLRETHAEFTEKFPDKYTEGSGCVPVWKYRYHDKGSLVDVRTRVELNLLKSEQSDQFWWSVGAEVLGKKNFSRYMIDSVLDYYSELAQALESVTLPRKISNIKTMLTLT